MFLHYPFPIPQLSPHKIKKNIFWKKNEIDEKTRVGRAAQGGAA
jgi:hypothetical protein